MLTALLMVLSSTAMAHQHFPPDHPPEVVPVETTPAPEMREKIRCDLTVTENGATVGNFATPMKVMYEDAQMTALYVKVGNVEAGYNSSTIHPDVTHVVISFGEKEQISVNPNFDSSGRAEITYAKGVGTPNPSMIIVACRKTGEKVASTPISNVP